MKNTHTYTIGEVLEYDPCYSRERLEELWAGREALTLAEMLELDISEGDKAWAYGYFNQDPDLWFTWKDGTEEWWLDGQLHRDGDKPAVIFSDGRQEWYQHGLLHRDDDKPAVVRADGGQHWFQRGKHHRDGDLPAVVYLDGHQEWWRHGKQHRDDGKPAIVRANGDQEWWVDGVWIRRSQRKKELT